MKKIKAAIVGVTGFAGEKLIEILAKHPNVELTSLSCRLEKPKPIGQHYPQFAHLVKLDMEPINPENIAKKADLIFLALPHTVSFNYVPLFLAKNKIVIDLSADYRLKNPAAYNDYYKVEHPDINNIEKAVYGLPELYRTKIKKAKLLSNPGCYPTVCSLSLAPLADKNLVDNIIIDAKSAITGAGRKADLEYHYTAINGNLYAYRLFKHQHTPEIIQVLSDIAGKKVDVLFTPHVVPIEQGILATIYADLKTPLAKPEVIKLYQNFYKNEYFIRVMPEGLPKIKSVFNTNFCDIGLEVQGKKIIIVAVIDNLVRGAAGQAVHNMNIICGFDEKAGLL
jgi:N-acetyl-gamma-glutamyl-phosphate reductase